MSNSHEDTSMSSWSPPSLSLASAADLLALQAATISELRDRRILRTSNPPVGDYAEWLVARALGSELEMNANPSYDLTSTVYGRVQVKARVVSTPVKAGQLQASVFRSKDFDHAALVLISAHDFTVRSAVLLPAAIVEARWRWYEHVRGWRLQMNGPTMGHPEAIDITADLNAAALDSGSG